MRMLMTGAALAVALAGCTATGAIDGGKAAGYQAKIAAACKTAMAVTVYAPTISPWIVAGCSGESMIAKLALDPTSLEWVNGLIEKARAVAR